MDCFGMPLSEGKQQNVFKKIDQNCSLSALLNFTSLDTDLNENRQQTKIGNYQEAQIIIFFFFFNFFFFPFFISKIKIAGKQKKTQKRFLTVFQQLKL